MPDRIDTLNRRTFLGAAAAAGTLLLPAGAFAAPKAKKLVMLAGRPSHGPGAHEFNAGVLLLAKCLGKVDQVEVSVYKNGWPESEKAFEGADGIFLFADGGGGLFETVKTPMFDMAGRLVGVLGIARDITARVEAERALRDSQERSQQCLNALGKIVRGDGGF